MTKEFAVIKTGGKQYRVMPGDILEVEKFKKPVGSDKVIFDRVLLYVKDDKVKFGQPLIAGAAVEAQWLGELRSKKITVQKFKRKVGYRKKYGHRQPFVRVKIESINLSRPSPDS